MAGPAIIVFNSDGKELAKRSGYIESEEFKKMIKELSENPDKPEPEAVEEKISYSANNIFDRGAKKRSQL